MLKLFRICGFLSCLLFSFFQLSFAEDITITTYYPSPFGNYRELRAARIAVGDTYIDGVAFTWENVNGDGGEVDFQADLVVEGNVGMGTANPQGPLQVQLPAWTNRDTDSQHVIFSNVTDLNAGLRFGFNRASMLGSVNVLNPGVAWGNLILQDGGGNVGIGTTAPGAYKLNVNGNVYVGGANGVTATIFRDLNTAYFLNPDPGSQYSHSGAIRGSLTIGESTNFSNAAALFVRRNSTAGNLSAIFVTDGVGSGIIANGAQSGIHGEGFEGVTGRGSFAGVRADCNQAGCYDFYGDGPRTHFAGSVGIGTTTPVGRLQVVGEIVGNSSLNILNSGTAGNGNQVVLRKDGNNAYLWPWGTGTPTNTVYVGGGAVTNFTVSGVKNFEITHPLKPNMRLVHSTLEGPEVAVFYRGESQLVNGKVKVVLPDYFESLTRKENRAVLITAKFEGDELISNLAASAVTKGSFFVRAVDDKNPNQKFYWEVKAVRADVPLLVVEKKADKDFLQ